MFGTLPSRFAEHLKRDTNCNAGAAGIVAVVQVIPAVVVRYVNIVGFVPVIPPVFRIRINGAEPIAAVLKARIPANVPEGKAVDAERVVLAIVAIEIGVRNAVAVVAAALLPIAVLGVPIAGRDAAASRPAVRLAAQLPVGASAVAVRAPCSLVVAVRAVAAGYFGPVSVAAGLADCFGPVFCCC